MARKKSQQREAIDSHLNQSTAISNLASFLWKVVNWPATKVYRAIRLRIGLSEDHPYNEQEINNAMKGLHGKKGKRGKSKYYPGKKRRLFP